MVPPFQITDPLHRRSAGADKAKTSSRGDEASSRGTGPARWDMPGQRSARTRWRAVDANAALAVDARRGRTGDTLGEVSRPSRPRGVDGGAWANLASTGICGVTGSQNERTPHARFSSWLDSLRGAEQSHVHKPWHYLRDTKRSRACARPSRACSFEQRCCAAL